MIRVAGPVHDLVAVRVWRTIVDIVLVVAAATTLHAKEAQRLGELVGPAVVVAAAGLFQLGKVDLVVGRVALVERALVGCMLLDLLPADGR